MESPTFGSVLRQARERRRLSLSELSDQTKVPIPALQLIESGKLDDLPPETFVRGFIRTYARHVGIADQEPLGLFDQAIDARNRAQAALVATPAPASPEDEGAQRPGLGLAVFVIIMLLIATITLSLFLRQPPQSGEGLSFLAPVDAWTDVLDRLG